MTADVGQVGAPWVRLHPLTPLLRGGRFVLLIAAVVGQQSLRGASAPGLATAVVFAVVVPVSVLVGYLSWRAMRYRVTAEDLEVESGVLTKRSRRVPLARVQAVDVVRPFYARVLGLAELRLEVVGGGGGAEAPLAFLTDDQALRLRSRLLDLSAGRTPGSPQDEGGVEAGGRGSAPHADPERILLVVPTGTLIRSTLLGAPLVLLVLMVPAVAVTAAVELSAVPGLLLGAAPLLLGVGSFAVRRFLSGYDFTVAETPDGLRLRYGLLDTRSQTIPPSRIQVVRLLQPVLWRPFGWVRVEFDVAGYGGGSEELTSVGALLPVAPRDLAERLVARVLGAPPPVAGRRPSPQARWRAPFSYRRLAVGLDERHLVVEHGLVTTTRDVVPLAKVQSLRLTQGPWQRRLGLTTLHADTAGRRLGGALGEHRSDADARRLLAEATELARVARGTGPRG